MSRDSGQTRSEEAERRKSLGRAGENVARQYLEAQSFRILHVNYRYSGGEADIIVRKGRLIVFIEVKTRVDAGDSIESYGRRQQQRLVHLSEKFLAENADLLPAVYDMRYDVILVGEDGHGGLEIKEHIEDAFRPE